MLLLEVPTISNLITTVGVREFFAKLCTTLTEDFSQWQKFYKSSRHAIHVPHGVIELMPICNEELYSFKYVNGHPNNPLSQKLNIVAFGMLADVVTGYPLMIASMTLLTAMRTAAVSALSSRYLAKKNSCRVAIIGCGAQSEFQIIAHDVLFSLTHVYYYDIDAQAMQRFERQLCNEPFQLMPAISIEQAVADADIIITATAAKGHHIILKQSYLHAGQHICAIGGDSPGKTELDIEILKLNKIVVEYFAQTVHEGEIQQLGDSASDYVYAELWELISGVKSGRTNASEITIFDSVGFALEDFSILRLCYQLANELNLGRDIQLISHGLDDCKNLYGLIG